MTKPTSRHKEKGQTLVEFALSIVLVMLLIVGSIELIVTVYTYSVLADAAKEGVRYAIVHGTGLPAPAPPQEDPVQLTQRDFVFAPVPASPTVIEQT